MKTTRLKRCPFCGGKAKLSLIAGTIYNVNCEDVKCAGVTGPIRSGKASAVKAWNQRPKKKARQ